MKSKKSNYRKYYIQALIWGLFTLFILLSVFAAKVPFFGLDLRLSHSIQRINAPLFGWVMRMVSLIGDGLGFEFLIGVAAAMLVYVGLRIEALLTIFFTSGSAIFGVLVKNIVNRGRPESGLVYIYQNLTDKSFPSLHVLVYTTFFGFMLYLSLFKVKSTWKRFLISLGSALLILSIGISRIFLGAHWASDTLGGYMLGLIFLIINIKIYRKLTV